VLAQKLKIIKPQEEIPAAFFLILLCENTTNNFYTKRKKLDYQFSFLLDQKRSKKNQVLHFLIGQISF